MTTCDNCISSHLLQFDNHPADESIGFAYYTPAFMCFSISFFWFHQSVIVLFVEWSCTFVVVFNS